MPPAPTPEDYVELRCRSAFSFLEGASNPEDLAERAGELDHGVLALADRDGLYGIPRFHAAARAVGVRPLVGATLAVGAAPAGATTRLTLLVESRRGWRNLCRLITRAQAGRPKGEALASWDALEEHASGLCALLDGDADLDASRLDRTLGVFGRARSFVAVSRALERDAARAEGRVAALAEARRVAVVATSDVRHARAEGRRLLDALVCLRHKTTLDRAGRRLAANAERHLKTRAEVAARFADRPAWVAATRAVAERCEFTLAGLGYRFPTFPVPAGESQASRLRALTLEGAARRYGMPLPPRARRQIEHELALIARLGLDGYFLIVWDIVRFAREAGILAQGRGSAANSAVCYALGITAVDAVGMDLLFERFLSEERGEWPDIDVDLPSGDERERVIQYVYAKYGPHGAGMTANVITYRVRSALREMGKVLGHDPGTIDRVTKLVSSWERDEEKVETQAGILRAGGIDPEAPRVRAWLGLANAVRGLPRHLGQHSGGIVIAAGRLDEVVPLEPASMPGRTVVQWDKEDCADLGIIKIDLLGLGMLDALEKTLPLVREHEGVALDLAKLPTDDAKTWAMIQRADTVGVFQIESRAQMATLPRMRPERFYDLVVEIAIIRPGPIVGQMVHPYLERRAGREPVAYADPCLEPILARTLGIPIFQEQLLRIAMTAAGFSGGEAEELRRAMGFKRSVERMARIESRLRAGMAKRGIDGPTQDLIVRQIGSFAQYGFPESHSASFALIAWASAYLKANHPAAFLVGLLEAQPMGFYSPATLVKDAQRHGVEVRPVDVRASHWASTLEEGDGGPAVRLGLRCVTGLRREAAQALVAERGRGAFASLADLTRRVALRADELATLAELGALCGVDPGAPTRRSALWQIVGLERDPTSLFAGVGPGPPPAAGGGPNELPAGASPPDASPLPEMTPFEETAADYRASGLTPGPHVMGHLRDELRARGVLSAAEVTRTPNGRVVRTAGHVIVRQRPGSAKGFCFLTLEDETGLANAILTPKWFRRFRAVLNSASIVEIAGPLQNVDGVVHLRVRELRAIAGRRSLPRSHDYR
ncbi:MAG TPA: error-prone DNA polymerase [Myxococcota bacterium]|nr:error-prone DNA polymerase [Myxococcota bacterium]